METRIFGRTGHLSTVAIFGAAAFWEISQEKADAVMEMILEAGINHIDVAPSYGQAEERVGPFLQRHPGRFFIGCKTMERSKEGAAAEMRRSLERLHLEAFDLYQFHAVTRFEELDEIFQTGGALEAVLEARKQGLLRFIGITGHGVDAPAIYREALRRFDFDSVLFPLNFVQYANPYYRENAEALLDECEKRQVATMIIKSTARGPWGEKNKTHTTWYEPFTEEEMIQKAVNFVLSQKVTGICTAGDISVLPLVIQACQRFTPMNQAEQEQLIASASKYEPLFV